MKLFIKSISAMLIILLLVYPYKTSATAITPLPIHNSSLSMTLKIKDVMVWKLKDLQHATDHKLTLKEKTAFLFLKHKMKKAAKQNPDMTVGDFVAAQGAKNKIGWILVIGLALLLILFLVVISNALPN